MQATVIYISQCISPVYMSCMHEGETNHCIIARSQCRYNCIDSPQLGVRGNVLPGGVSDVFLLMQLSGHRGH